MGNELRARLVGTAAKVRSIDAWVGLAGEERSLSLWGGLTCRDWAGVALTWATARAFLREITLWQQ